MTKAERVNQVNIIRRWYERGAGKLLVETFLPNHAAAIAQHYKTPQDQNDKSLAGTYRFDFIQGATRHTAYVGESGNIYWRLLEHFYCFMNGVSEWGIPAQAILNKDIKIEWSGKVGTTGKSCRESDEALLIDSLKPFLQYTDPNSKEYGDDKKMRGLTREEIRPDICVCSHLRKARAEQLFSF